MGKQTCLPVSLSDAEMRMLESVAAAAVTSSCVRHVKRLRGSSDPHLKWLARPADWLAELPPNHATPIAGFFYRSCCCRRRLRACCLRSRTAHYLDAFIMLYSLRTSRRIARQSHVAYVGGALVQQTVCSAADFLLSGHRAAAFYLCVRDGLCVKYSCTSCWFTVKLLTEAGSPI